MKSITRVLAFLGLFLMAGQVICAAAVPALPATAITPGSAYENKARGFHIWVPAGWDFEDLGASPEGRWDFLVKTPARKIAGGIHVTRHAGSLGTNQISNNAVAEITQGRTVKEIVEEPATLGKLTGRVIKVVYGGRDGQGYSRIYVFGQDSACWVFHCFLEAADASLEAEMDSIIQKIRLSAKPE